jgi:hypothetical protein
MAPQESLDPAHDVGRVGPRIRRVYWEMGFSVKKRCNCYVRVLRV